MTTKLKKKSWSLHFLLNKSGDDAKGSAYSGGGGGGGGCGDEFAVEKSTGKLIVDGGGVGDDIVFRVNAIG